jgi:heparanase
MRSMILIGAALLLPLSACTTMSADQASSADLQLSSLAKLGTVDERYQSYNVEMVEVTGGRFWAPYGGPKGELHRMRPPLDLSAPRIRALAKPLGPVYMRVSGTWANSTYIPLEGEKFEGIPAGFQQVLTRDQWRGVIDFAKAMDAKIVTSFPASEGARAPDGSWTTEQAQRMIDLTREAGGSIYGAELFNEPSVPPFGGFPKGYSANEFTRDFRIFHEWARKAAPEMKLTGPGGASEGTMLKHTPENEARGFLGSEALLKNNPGRLDIFSYHFYGAASVRCGSSPTGSKETALTAEWLDLAVTDHDFYAGLRDTYEPGKPIWLNETAQAACGGSPWASTFLDSFRYVNQLGALAQKGVQVVAHNTLAASDYALIDYDTMMPRPNYWAAVLWAKNMGSTVLASPASPSPDVRIYAHCLKGHKGGVGLVAMNIGASPQSINVGNKAESWTMSATPMDGKNVSVNGNNPVVQSDGTITGLDSAATNGRMTLPSQSIAFVAISGANNSACR